MSDARHLHYKERHNIKTKPKPIPHEHRAACVETVPNWIPLDTWNEYLIHRARKDRKPLSEYAQRLAIAALDKLRNAGHDPRSLIEQSILNNWSGFFPPRVNSNAATRMERNMANAGLHALDFRNPKKVN